MRNAKSQYVCCRYGLVLSAQERQVSPSFARAGDQSGQRTISKVAEMKFAATRPYSDPEAPARKLIELANAVEAVQDGRILIELINGPMLLEHKATPAEYGAGLKRAIDRGWAGLDRSGTYVRFTQSGAELLHRRSHSPATRPGRFFGGEFMGEKIMAASQACRRRQSRGQEELFERDRGAALAKAWRRNARSGHFGNSGDEKGESADADALHGEVV
jgi:hypothetical protein